jgi:hypothetical protein
MKTWIIDVQEDTVGDCFIELPEDLLAEAGWKEGDTIHFDDNGDGSFTMSKREWVLVEAISQFRERYLVQVPQGKTDWALDTVTMEEAKEFSQKHLGETIVSHRIVSQEEALKLCDVDNDYCKHWSEEQKIDNFFTKIEDYDPSYVEVVDPSVERFAASVNMLMNPPTEVYEELRK